MQKGSDERTEEVPGMTEMEQLTQSRAPIVRSHEDKAFVQQLPFTLSYAANLRKGDRVILAEYLCADVEAAIERHHPTSVVGLNQLLG